MFTDVRSKKVIFVSHCILNQNSISDGTADYPAVNEAVVRRIMESGIGIIQMPCPELSCLGLDRGDIHGAARDVVVENTRIRNSMGQPRPRDILDCLVSQTIYQIEEYFRYGFSILGIVGINRSPSCGVETTSDHDQEVKGEGVFIEALRRALEQKRISVPMIGIKATETEKALKSIETILWNQG
jgi:predicted secreted protein